MASLQIEGAAPCSDDEKILLRERPQQKILIFSYSVLLMER